MPSSLIPWPFPLHRHQQLCPRRQPHSPCPSLPIASVGNSLPQDQTEG